LSKEENVDCNGVDGKLGSVDGDSSGDEGESRKGTTRIEQILSSKRNEDWRYRAFANPKTFNDIREPFI